jgi:hypothetical protein
MAALALHGTYGPMAGAGAKAQFASLSFSSATAFTAVKANCRVHACRIDGTYVFDGSSQLDLTDGATGEVTHVEVSPLTLSPAGVGTPSSADLHVEGVDLGGGASVSLTSGTSVSLTPTIGTATMNGTPMQFVSGGDAPPPSTGPITVPITSANSSAIVMLQVGNHGTPIAAVLDTGSQGIWIASDYVDPEDGIDQDEAVPHQYGASQKLTGEVKSYHVWLGPNRTVRTIGVIPVAVVTGASCSPPSASCDDGSKNGTGEITLGGSLHAVVGIAMEQQANEDGVVSPFGGFGQQTEQIIMQVGPVNNPNADLIIDPSSEQQAPFQSSLHQFAGDGSGGFDDKRMPISLNGYSTVGVLDSGETTGFVIDDRADVPNEIELLDFAAPSPFPTLAANANVPLTGKDLTVSVNGVLATFVPAGAAIVPGTNQFVFREKTPPASNNLGIAPFRTLDVFLDEWNGVEGVAPNGLGGS